MADTAYADSGCANRAAGQLAEIADMTPAALDIARRLSSTQSGSGGRGVAESTLPLDLGATARLDAVERELIGWLRHITEERGSALWPGDRADPLVHCARELARHLEWFRHRAEVDEFLGDVEACARVVRGIARGPRESKYLGPCGALRPIVPCGKPYTGSACENCDLCDFDPCDGDVYGPAGGTKGTCRTCGAEVAQAERQVWIDAITRDRAYRASEIEDAHGVKAHSIRMWADRGQIRVHAVDARGRNLYLLGEVLNHAADMVRRRAEREAKRHAAHVA